MRILDINYEGLFNEKNIETFLGKRSYKDNICIWDALYERYKGYSPSQFDMDEFTELKILLVISLKYNYQRIATKEIIYNKMQILESALFHLGELYFQLLSTKSEKERWLDDCIEHLKNKSDDHANHNVCKFLEGFIYNAKNIDKGKYKEIYADTCIKIAKSFSGLIAHHWYTMALSVYKQLGLKDKYKEALKNYNANMESVKNEFQVHETKIENEEMQKEIYKQRKIVYEFFYNQLETVADKINALTYIVVFKNFGKFTYQYMPFFQKEKNNFKEHSLLNSCNVVTLSGNKTVKTLDDQIGFDWIGRELTREMQIVPAVQGVLDSIKDKSAIINEILKSPLIFENDQRHIKKALDFLLDEDYDTFIYIIIPNFEKILRNVLVVNDIPEYGNKNTETKYQATLNLKETLNSLKENHLLNTNLIEKISQVLNDENYENYRNKLSHREDDSIFTKRVAYDLFVLFVQIIKNYDDKGEITVLTGTSLINEK